MNARLIFVSGAALALLAACAETPASAPPIAAAPPPPRAAAQAAAPAPPPPTDTSAQFRVGDFAWSKTPGKGSVAGQVTYKQGGKQFVCADQGVALAPETAWVKRRMEILYLSSDHATLPAADVRGRTPPERNAEYDQFVKRTTCDPTGKFNFTGLADGTWYVISVVRSAPSVPAGEMAVMRRVVVRNGAVAKVSL